MSETSKFKTTKMPPRLTIEQVKEAIEKEGCKLVSTTYTSNKKPITIICSCGNPEPITTTFMNFNCGTRCNAYTQILEKKLYHKNINPDK